jgi:hypothetical protein
MPYQPITATVAPADVTAIKAVIVTIQQKLSFLITLTDAERKSLPKAGANSFSFVEHAQTAADNKLILHDPKPALAVCRYRTTAEIYRK